MHLEVLTNETRKVWDRCTFDQEVYLAGGTALALQIGHRISIDLDFFSDSVLKKNLLAKVEEHFQGSSIRVVVKTDSELTVFIDTVKVTFVYYPFVLLYPRPEAEPKLLASIPDVASMKAYTLGRRQSLKDYIDLYCIIKGKYIDLAQIIIDAQIKFGDAFNDRLFLEQLTYVDDLEEEPIVYLGEVIDIQTVQEFFREKVKEYLK